MNIEELDALMAESVKQFNELKVEEGVTKTRLETIDTNLKRLQGEHEAYQTLKNTLIERSAQVQPPQADSAGLTPDPFKKKAKANDAEVLPDAAN